MLPYIKTFLGGVTDSHILPIFISPYSEAKQSIRIHNLLAPEPLSALLNHLAKNRDENVAECCGGFLRSKGG